MCKIYVKKLFNTMILLLVTLFIVITYVLDPYLEYDFFRAGFNYPKFSQSKLTTKTLYNRLKYDKFILLFGTSRSHKITSEMLEENILNFTPIYGNPIAVKDFLYSLSNEQVKNIKKIYFLLDFHVFLKDKLLLDVKFDSKIEDFFYSVNNFNNKKIQDSISMVYKNLSKEYNKYIDDSGSINYIQDDKKDPDFVRFDIERIEHNRIKKRQYFDKESVKSLRRIEEFVNKNKIKIIYYTAPLPTQYILKMDSSIKEKLKNEIVDNIDAFYDFTNIDGISNDLSYFTDAIHLSNIGMKKFVKILLKQDRKYLEEKDNQ